jgi:hypothetical protein
MSTAEVSTGPHWDRLQRGALIVGVVGLLLCAVGALVSPEHFFRSYLTAYNFWLAVGLGCLVVLMIQHLTGGAWGILLRRVLESGSRTLLPSALFIVPLLFGLRWLYEWANPDPNALDEDLKHKSTYLNVPFFSVRIVIYFVVWLVIAGILNRWSRMQDDGAPPLSEERHFRLLSGPGLVLYGLTITFASIDWVMSLEPRWWSTMYPPLFGAGQVLEGVAFAVIVLILLSEYPPLSAIVRPVHLRDLGNLLLTFVMIWAYLSFSQFLLIWAENMPEETPWYLKRLRGGYEWVALLLVLFQFAIPFVFLLFRDIKENRRKLLAVAVLVLVMRFVDLYWWIEAAFPGGMSFYGFLDVAAVVGLGGLWLWWFLRELRKRPLLPLHDPYMAEYLPEAVRHD